MARAALLGLLRPFARRQRAEARGAELPALGLEAADDAVGIRWPEGVELIPSERDASAPSLRDVQDELPFRY